MKVDIFDFIIGFTLCLLSFLCLCFTFDIKDLQTDINDLQIELEDVNAHFKALEDYIAELNLKIGE